MQSARYRGRPGSAQPVTGLGPDVALPRVVQDGQQRRQHGPARCRRPVSIPRTATIEEVHPRHRRSRRAPRTRARGPASADPDGPSRRARTPRLPGGRARPRRRPRAVRPGRSRWRKASAPTLQPQSLAADECRMVVSPSTIRALGRTRGATTQGASVPDCGSGAAAVENVTAQAGPGRARSRTHEPRGRPTTTHGVPIPPAGLGSPGGRRSRKHAAATAGRRMTGRALERTPRGRGLPPSTCCHHVANVRLRRRLETGTSRP